MARLPFTPPEAGEPEVLRAALPTRERGAFAPWHPGPTPPSMSSASRPTERPPEPRPAGPDPVVVAFEQAKAKGMAAGLEQGKAQAIAAVAGELDHLQRSIDAVLDLRSVLAEVYRQEMVELALAAAEAVLQSELREHGEKVRNLVEQGLQALGHREELRVTLCPTDAERLRAWIETLDPPLLVRESTKLQVGDIRLESASGSVETVMRDRIHRARQLILGELAAESRP